jgi:protein phosphatase
MNLVVASISETNKRPDNQDAYTATVTAFGNLFIVCDGMGGTLGGAHAANYVCSHLGEAIDTYAGRRDLSTQQVMVHAIEQINIELYQLSQEQPTQYRGMGTTLVAALETPAGFMVCNVGDSRAYSIGSYGIRLLTRDHTLVNLQVEEGLLTQEEARSHPKRSILTRAVATAAHIEVEFHPRLLPLTSGEGLLLCSDGIWSRLSDPGIYRISQTVEDIRQLPRFLWEEAEAQGSRDNATCIYIYRPINDKSRHAPPTRRIIPVPREAPSIKNPRQKKFFIF